MSRAVGIYEDLTADDLLPPCLRSYTQNNNESLNSIIWTIAAKHFRCGRDSVETVTLLAVCIFNEGFKSTLQIMSVMSIIIGQKQRFSQIKGTAVLSGLWNERPPHQRRITLLSQDNRMLEKHFLSLRSVHFMILEQQIKVSAIIKLLHTS